ncbi:hypothetical protein L6452_08292 [Arctium lappa]|uniref:Uncharacterized protein n=1 Tax=Arctium lappa TaxID=4217 RepID=A0ACB9DHC8_ARCLA|nr:hypothetical protein L6452_08292 [Arctium lappa]
MKAVVITTPGGPEVLKLQEVEEPKLKDDDVLIRVEATALNIADMLQRQGKYPPPNGESEYPGLECSGTIEAVLRQRLPLESWGPVSKSGVDSTSPTTPPAETSDGILSLVEVPPACCSASPSAQSPSS